MSPNEIEEKLSAMLHENLKLKETLAENTEVMKKQFNSLAAFQDELSIVHQNHKQKFADTLELINQLKKENMELKLQISVVQAKSMVMLRVIYLSFPRFLFFCDCCLEYFKLYSSLF